MNVERTRYVDSGEPNADGTYDFYYKYDIYRFTEDNVILIARSYADSFNEAHFLRIEHNGKSRLLVENDINSSLLRKAMMHLKRDGKTKFNWLSWNDNTYLRISDTT